MKNFNFYFIAKALNINDGNSTSVILQSQIMEMIKKRDRLYVSLDLTLLIDPAALPPSVLVSGNSADIVESFV